jgi:hypothetical protein
MNSPVIQPMMGPAGEGLAHMLRENAYDLVIIMVGTNDLGHFHDISATQAFAMRLHNACHSLGIPTVNIAPPQVSEQRQFKKVTREVRDARNRLADSMGTWARSCSNVLLSLDCETLVPKNVAQLWERDNIHLSTNGSQQLGQKLASQLVPVLGQLPLSSRSPRQQPIAQEHEPTMRSPALTYRSNAYETPQRVGVGSIRNHPSVQRQRPMGFAKPIGLAPCARTAMVGTVLTPPRVAVLCI